MSSIIDDLKAHQSFEPHSYYAQKFPKFAGKTKFVTNSPFREDKHPSFSIDCTTGRWYDHGTNEGGDVLDFEAKNRGTSTQDKDFLKGLARDLGIGKGNGPMPSKAPADQPQPAAQVPPPPNSEPSAQPAPAKKKKGRKKRTPLTIAKLAADKGLTEESLHEIHAHDIKRSRGREVCFPMVNPAGKMIGYRRRFDSGDPLTNKGGNLGLFVPKSFDRASKVVYWPEGETDLAAAVMMGMADCAIGLPGTGKCPEMVAQVCRRRGAEAILLADNDPPNKKTGIRPGKYGAERIGRICCTAKVKVKIWYPPNEGQDLRDWMQAGGTLEKLKEEVASLKYFEVDPNEYISECVEANAEQREPNPAEVARDFLQMTKVRDGVTCMRFYKGEFFEFSNKGWQPVPMDGIRAEVWKFAEKFLIHGGPTRGKIGNYLEALNALTYTTGKLDMPFWLDPDGGAGGTPADADSFIAVQNGLLDMRTHKLIEITSRYFNRNVLPITYDPDAECPRWESFLMQIFKNDIELLYILQEYFGYCFLSDNRYQRFILMHGEGDNGKSQVLDVLGYMLGDANVSNVPLDQFPQRFGLYPTIGMMVNICADVSELDKVAEGYLKAFTAGDRMTFDRKGIQPVNLRISTKLLMSCNMLPRFHDRSRGLWRRMLLLPFKYQVAEADKIENLGLKIFQAEAAGIFNWALEGLQRLEANRKFTRSAVSDEAQAKYKMDCNPAESFLRDCVGVCPTGSIGASYLYDEYVNWSRSSGFFPLNLSHFGRQIVSVFPNVEIRKIYDTKTGKRSNNYFGIDWLERMGTPDQQEGFDLD